MQVICAVVLVPVLVAVGVLMTWHFLLLLHNKTTIEVLPLVSLILEVVKQQYPLSYSDF